MVCSKVQMMRRKVQMVRSFLRMVLEGKRGGNWVESEFRCVEMG